MRRKQKNQRDTLLWSRKGRSRAVRSKPYVHVTRARKNTRWLVRCLYCLSDFLNDRSTFPVFLYGYADGLFLVVRTVSLAAEIIWPSRQSALVTQQSVCSSRFSAWLREYRDNVFRRLECVSGSAHVSSCRPNRLSTCRLNYLPGYPDSPVTYLDSLSANRFRCRKLVRLFAKIFCVTRRVSDRMIHLEVQNVYPDGRTFCRLDRLSTCRNYLSDYLDSLVGYLDSLSANRRCCQKL